MKVGIAGAGLMGKTHAEGYRKINGVEIYALAETNPSKQKYFQNLFSPAKIYDEAFSMIEDSEIDIIDICLPTPFHTNIAVAALDKNKHVLLEKPIALNLDDAALIKKASEASKGKFMVAHVLRFWPDYLSLRNAIKDYIPDEQIVEIYASRFNELPLWSEGTWIMNEEQSGGLIIDLIIHDIDFIIWNLGKVRRVFCHGIFNDKNFALQVMAILEMKNGAVAYVEGGYLNPSGSGLSSQMKIYSKNSLLEICPHNHTIKITSENKPIKEINVLGEDGYFEEINYFINCIKENTNPQIITTDDAIESLKTCLALKKSIRKEQWISID